MFHSTALEPLLIEEPKTKLLYESNNYQDIVFLFLFLINSLIIVAIATSYGIIALISKNGKVVIIKDGSAYNETNHYTPSVLILLGVLTIQSFSITMSMLWIYFISLFMASIAKVIYISIIVVPMICGLITFFCGYYVFGSILLIFALLLSIISLMLKPNIDFASINLQVACISVMEMPNIFYYSSLVLVTEIVYTCVWSIAAIGMSTNNSEVTLYSGQTSFDLPHQCVTYEYSDSLELSGISLACGSSRSSSNCYSCVCSGKLISNSPCFTPKVYGWSLFWMLLSFIWTSTIFANIIHCSTASSVSMWWKSSYQCNQYVHESFLRSCTTSLGSICFASLLVSIIQTLRTLLFLIFKNTGYNSSNRIFKCIIDYIKYALHYMLQVLEGVVAYFNRYALCIVAIHRCDFMKASIIATNLFAQSGYHLVLNDSLIDIVLFVGPLVIGLVSMCIGYIYSVLVSLPHAYIILLTVFGFISGYLLSLIMLSIVSSAVAAIYVCYIDNPDILQVSHPELASSMLQVWSNTRSVNHANVTNTNNKMTLLEASMMKTATRYPILYPNTVDRTIRGNYHKLEASPDNNVLESCQTDISVTITDQSRIIQSIEALQDTASYATKQLWSLISDTIYQQSKSSQNDKSNLDEIAHINSDDNFEESFSV